MILRKEDVMPEPISMEECFAAGFIPSDHPFRRAVTAEDIARLRGEDDDEEEAMGEFHASPVFGEDDDLDGDDPCETHNEEDCPFCVAEH